MSNNPALNDQILKREAQASGRGGFSPAWGSPADELPPGVFGVPPQAGPAGGTVPPPPDHRQRGPVEGAATMTVGGSLVATAVLLAIVAVAFVFGWSLVKPTYGPVMPDGTQSVDPNVPGWLILLTLAGLGIAIFNAFKPRYSVIAGPVYALLMGTVLGAWSHAYESIWDGIVVQAVAATLAVFTVMLGLYATRVIRVTDRLRSTIVAATGGILVLYLVAIGLRLLFDVEVPFLNDSGPLGILLSVAICGIAAFNLLLDFDFIEQGTRMGAPRYMEWYAAFGLMTSLVWLYLEILRLLAKLRDR